MTKQKKQLETHEKETGELTKIKEKLEADKNIEDKKLSEVIILSIIEQKLQSSSENLKYKICHFLLSSLNHFHLNMHKSFR